MAIESTSQTQSVPAVVGCGAPQLSTPPTGTAQCAAHPPARPPLAALAPEQTWVLAGLADTPTRGAASSGMARG